MSESTIKEMFNYLVEELAKLEAECHRALKQQDFEAFKLAESETAKIKTSAETFNINVNDLEFESYLRTLDIISL